MKVLTVQNLPQLRSEPIFAWLELTGFYFLQTNARCYRISLYLRRKSVILSETGTFIDRFLIDQILRETDSRAGLTELYT